jgi:hypothetical protein
LTDWSEMRIGELVKNTGNQTLSTGHARTRRFRRIQITCGAMSGKHDAGCQEGCKCVVGQANSGGNRHHGGLARFVGRGDEWGVL